MIIIQSTPYDNFLSATELTELDILRETLVTEFKESRLHDASSNVDDDGIHDPAVIEDINAKLISKAKTFYYETVKDCIKRNTYSRFGVMKVTNLDGVNVKNHIIDIYEPIAYIHAEVLDEFAANNYNAIGIWPKDLAKLLVITALESAICEYLKWADCVDKTSTIINEWSMMVPVEIRGSISNFLKSRLNVLAMEQFVNMLRFKHISQWALLSVRVNGCDVTIIDEGDYRIHAYYNNVAEGCEQWPLGKTPRFVD